MTISTETTTTAPVVAWPAPIKSFDVHVYWLPSSKAQYEEAMALKAKAEKLFPQLSHGMMWDGPSGPHPYNMFEIDIYNAIDFATFVPWMILNHGNLSVLIHPQAGNDVRDHTFHAMWLGQPVPLDMGLLEAFDARMAAEAAAATAAAAATEGVAAVSL
ncbi:DOPA-like domain-containing protein [Blastocladiella britannica]|nr:DOPA-like domain-containing protein [Blastocladiella britannica]